MGSYENDFGLHDYDQTLTFFILDAVGSLEGLKSKQF